MINVTPLGLTMLSAGEVKGKRFVADRAPLSKDWRLMRPQSKNVWVWADSLTELREWAKAHGAKCVEDCS